MMKKFISVIAAVLFFTTSAAAYTPIIDAGHGGFDGGAVSSSGVIESGLNLEISLKTAELFRLFGVEPVLIRETDAALGSDDRSGRSAKSADLVRRVEIINSVADGFLISVHQNMFGDSRYGGAHIFFKGDTAKPLADALQSDIKSQLDADNERVPKAVSSDVYIFKKASCPGILAECGFLSNAEDLALLQQDGYQKKLACVLVSGFLRLESGTLSDKGEG